jgi:hypothetical protein
MPEAGILSPFASYKAPPDLCVESDSAIHANQVNLVVAHKSLPLLSPALPECRVGVTSVPLDA